MKTILKIIYAIFICAGSLSAANAQSQRLPLDSVLARIAVNPALLSYDAKMSAEDAYIGGAKSLDAPKISAGQYQTPYQFNPNTGSFMIQAEQMFTNPAKLQAKENYMKSVSKVTAEDKKLHEKSTDSPGEGILLRPGYP